MALSASPAFQCLRSEAPPALIKRCCRLLPRAAARSAISPGRSLRAVKLLPMKSTLADALFRILVAMQSPKTGLPLRPPRHDELGSEGLNNVAELVARVVANDHQPAVRT